jgi:hypothetical protein
LRREKLSHAFADELHEKFESPIADGVRGKGPHGPDAPPQYASPS